MKKYWNKIWNHSWIIRNISFIIFLFAVGVAYVSIGHLHDKLLRLIGEKEEELKNLEYELKTTKSEVIFRSKSSELEPVVEKIGLKPLVTPPYIIKDTTKN